MNRSARYGALVVAWWAGACAVPGPSSSPQIASITPSLACAYQSNLFQVDGSNFAAGISDQGSASPSLLLPTVALQGPSSSSATNVTWEGTHGLSFVANPGPGIWQVNVTNPSGAHSGAAEIWTVPTPTVEPVPGSTACTTQAQQHTYVVQGTNFVEIGNQLPTVTVGGVAVGVSVNSNDCAAQNGAFAQMQLCDTLNLVLPANVPAGGQTVTVTNPSTLSGCPGTASQLLNVAGVTPSVNLPATLSLCSGGGPLTINGSNLSPMATVRIGTSAAVYNNSAACDPNSGLCQQLTANFGAVTGTGSLNLTVTNPGQCAAAQTAPVTLAAGPQLLAVEPAVVYTGSATTLTLYMHNWTDTLTAVQLVTADGTSAAVCGGAAGACTPTTQQGDSTGDVALSLPLSSGALTQLGNSAYGSLDIVVQTNRTCGAYLPRGLQWVAQPADVDMVFSPASAGSGSNSLITVSLSGAPQASLTAASRIYLVGPSHSGALQNVTWISSSTVQGTLPGNLTPAGTFEDMHVVITDTSMATWRSNQTWRLSSQAAPTITSVDPQILSPTANSTVRIAGNGFDGSMQARWINCVDGRGAQVQPAQPSLSGITGQSATLTTAPLGSVIVAPVVCTLQLVSGVDGQTVSQPQMAFVNSSGSLSATHDAGVTLATPRQNLAAAVVHLTPATGFVYAVGGRAAVTTNVVEYAPLNPNGGVSGSFVPNRNGMQTPRAQFGLVAVQHALYALGGTNESTAALTSIERAEVLDPNESPANLQQSGFGYVGGNSAGNYIYSVAALYSATDPYNPCGESLPSQPLAVNMPLSGMHPDITWSTPANNASRALSGYRVYRSTLNGGLGSLTYLTDVNATQYTDLANPTINSLACAGMPGPAATAPPLALGATSVWVTLGQKLGNGRNGAGFGAVQTATTTFVYALSGSDGKQLRDDYDVLPLNTAAGTHAATWEATEQVSDATLPLTACGGQSRSNAGMFVLNAANSSRDGSVFAIDATSQFVVLGPGISGGGTAVAALDAWSVAPTGLLASAGAQCLNTPGQISHYGGAAINSGLAFLGSLEHPANVGRVGWTSSSGSISFDLVYTDNTTTLVQPRSQGASAQDGPFVYLIGGVSAMTNSLTGEVEYGSW